jgi:2-phospho-L-lactate guanylyltransferase
MPRDVFVIPIKQFEQAKKRLRGGGTPDVTTLARRLAEGVLVNCRPREVAIVGESDDVATFAAEHGAEMITSPLAGLNAAVQHAYRILSPRFERVIIVHGDLRRPEGLADFDPGDGVTIVMDHLGLGTNVLALPTGLDFQFQYGRDSAALHQQEAARLNLVCSVVSDSPWRFDVDEPSDLLDQ